MKAVVVAWLTALVARLILDGLWLGELARGLYVSGLGELLRQPILVAPAAAFYVGYAAGLVFLRAVGRGLGDRRAVIRRIA